MRYLILLLMACSTQTSTETLRVPCADLGRIDVTDYGAVPWTDSTIAIRSAISASSACGGGTVYLPDFFYVSRQPGDWLGVITVPTGVTIEGPGAGAGGLILSGGSFTGDLYTVFFYRVADSGIRSLTIDGNRDQITGADEQTHSVVQWASQRIRYDHVEFRDSYGDGIKAFGDETDQSSFDVESSVFLNNGRSGVALQSGVIDSSISGTRFDGNDDQAIDLEPSGTEAITGLRIHANTIGGSDSNYAVALVGPAPDSPSRVIMTENTIVGSVIGVNLKRSIIARNTIVGTPGVRALELRHHQDQVTIEGNHITSTQEAGITIHAGADTTQARHVRVSGNTVLTFFPTAIMVVSARDLAIDSNTIVGAGARAIEVQTLYPSLETARLAIRGNDSRNFTDSLVDLHAIAGSIEDVMVSSNTCDAPAVWTAEGVVSGVIGSGNAIW